VLAGPVGFDRSGFDPHAFLFEALLGPHPLAHLIFLLSFLNFKKERRKNKPRGW